MKKQFLVCLIVGCLLSGCCCSAIASDIPVGIFAALQQAKITASAHWEEGEESTWFVAAETEKQENILYCFTVKDGVCAEVFQTNTALPQGEKRITLHISEGAWDFSGGSSGEERYIKGPILLILQHGTDNASVEQLMAFQRTGDDIWQLNSLKNYPKQADIKITENQVNYYAAVDKAQIQLVGTAPCDFERDLRYFCLSDVPLAYQ